MITSENFPLFEKFPTEGGEGGQSGEIGMVYQLLPVLNYDSFPNLMQKENTEN